MRGQPTTVCIQNYIIPAKRTKLVLRSLHFDHATYTENVTACQAYRFVGNAEAHGAQVVIKLRYNFDDFTRHFRTNCFGHRL
jgi:hypothetical protein